MRALVHKRLDPRSADALERTDERTIIVTDSLSPRTRTILAAAGPSYTDTTGNVLVMVGDPGLSNTAEGAGRNTAPRRQTMIGVRWKLIIER